jgi:hypothetical protein
LPGIATFTAPFQHIILFSAEHCLVPIKEKFQWYNISGDLSLSCHGLNHPAYPCSSSYNSTFSDILIVCFERKNAIIAFGFTKKIKKITISSNNLSTVTTQSVYS